jgi:hypothetical protein
MTNSTTHHDEKQEALRHEYSEVCSDIRNHSILRFNVFTVYLAAIGGISSIAFGIFEIKYNDPEKVKVWARIGGLIVTMLFFYYELRIQSLIDHNVFRLKVLEEGLGYNHYRSRPSWSWWRTQNATRVFFLALVLLWVVLTARSLFM